MLYVLLIVSLIINILVGHYISSKIGSDKNGPIYDVGFNILPNLEKYEHLPDYLLLVPIFFLVKNWSSWSINKRNSYLMFMSVIYFARAACNLVTVLPYTKEKPCKIRPYLSYCNDYTFSGHTSFNIVTSNFVGSPLWPIWPIISSLTSIATRDHYSLDIIIAWILFFALKCKIE